MKRIKVLIVDDQRSIRDILKELLSEEPLIDVVGEAENPLEARELIKQLEPDVLTLDVEMPKMDGITFLKNLMRLRPMPVVMLSTLTTKGADVTLDALDIGAVDFIAKPSLEDIVANQDIFKYNLVNKIKAAAQVEKRNYLHKVTSNTNAPSKVVEASNLKTRQIITIGASTGGTEAIKNVLTRLPVNTPPIVITQHIPEGFSARFANRLNQACVINVCEAKEGQKLEVGCAYVAPGDKHLKILKSGAGFKCALDDGEPVNRHKPSVDVLFNSIAKLKTKHVQAVLLTGMGQDGAEGMLALQSQGARTIAQDRASSLVWGMPGSAVALGATDYEISLNDIASTLIKGAEK